MKSAFAYFTHLYHTKAFPPFSRDIHRWPLAMKSVWEIESKDNFISSEPINSLSVNVFPLTSFKQPRDCKQDVAVFEYFTTDVPHNTVSGPLKLHAGGGDPGFLLP